ncbi:hypothetical protein V5738_11640 [Salinisphaera sp. SPP-AMP-43]
MLLIVGHWSGRIGLPIVLCNVPRLGVAGHAAATYALQDTMADS